MVTIRNLEVRFEVEGEGDEATFARLFQKYARLWSQQESARAGRERQAQAERALGDRWAEGSR